MGRLPTLGQYFAPISTSLLCKCTIGAIALSKKKLENSPVLHLFNLISVVFFPF